MRALPTATSIGRAARGRGVLVACGLGALALIAGPASSLAAASGPTFTPLAAGQGFSAYGGVSAPLPGGRVLMLGGRGPGGSASNAGVELFDPTTQTFTQIAAQSGAHPGAIAAPLPNGDVLIAGGDDAAPLEASYSSLAAAELFDPTSDSFRQLPQSGTSELQTPRSGAVAAPLPGGDVLIAGGVDYVPNGQSTTAVALQSAEIFDPRSDTFSALASTPGHELHTTRIGAVATPLPDGDVLIAGGSDRMGTPLRSAELFDPNTNAFLALPASGVAELQTARSGAAAAALPGGQVLIAGGTSGSGALQSAEIFDSRCDTFTALTSALTVPRSGALAAALPDGRVLIAGGALAPPSYADTAEIFSAGGADNAASCVPPALAHTGAGGHVRIVAAHIHMRTGRALFRFAAGRGAATAFECALVNASGQPPHYQRCAAHTTFGHLRAGRHVLYVRAPATGRSAGSQSRYAFRIA